MVHSLENGQRKKRYICNLDTQPEPVKVRAEEEGGSAEKEEGDRSEGYLGQEKSHESVAQASSKFTSISHPSHNGHFKNGKQNDPQRKQYWCALRFIKNSLRTESTLTLHYYEKTKSARDILNCFESLVQLINFHSV